MRTFHNEEQALRDYEYYKYLYSRMNCQERIDYLIEKFSVKEIVHELDNHFLNELKKCNGEYVERRNDLILSENYIELMVLLEENLLSEDIEDYLSTIYDEDLTNYWGGGDF